jgi:hypothetical protein
MTLAFNAAPFDTNDDVKASTYQSESNHNKTNKRSFSVPNKIDTMKKQLVLQSIDADDTGLVDFNPPSRPTSVGAERTKERSNEDNIEPQESDYMINKGISTKLSEGNYSEQYASPYSGQQPFDTNRAFVGKLEYMIHLLEEQREIKTGSATEEVILYSFLGVFIIFVLDSFARAGRYTR